ncbi:MAG: CPBP family intramembrane metalloprotease [bacterium]|nr:CPBP family intramembrane metalloprotease [bacterium]
MPTLRLLAAALGLLAATAVLSPWVAWGTQALGFDFKFSRVWNRVLQVLLVLAVVFGWRRLDLGNATQIGLRWPHWRRDLGLGLAAGVTGVGVALFVAYLGDGVRPAVRFDDPAKMVRKALAGLSGAMLIAVGEEALFRGVLLRRLVLDLGRSGGVAVTTAVYAVVHVLRPGGSREVYAWAGVDRVVTLFVPLADPAALPSIVGLAALGALLAWATLRTGSLWTAIGIHAAFVAVFRVGRLFVNIRRKPAWLMGPGWPPLIGGVAGLLAVALTGVLLWWALRRRALRGAEPVPTLAARA